MRNEIPAYLLVLLKMHLIASQSKTAMTMKTTVIQLASLDLSSSLSIRKWKCGESRVLLK